MTAPAPFPNPGDKEAVRQWMRAHRRSDVGRNVPSTPEEFSASQRQRLLQSIGVQVQAVSARRLDIALTGELTAHHTVRISVLGPFLANLQESVSAVAQALTGRPTSHAPIPKPVRDMTALSASALFPSSFGVTLYGPGEEEAEEGQFVVPVGDLGTVLDDAMDKVLDIIDLSEGSGPSDDLLAEELVPLGPRAMKHLGALTAGLADAGVGLRATWHGRTGQTRSGEWSPDGAQRVRDLCEQSEFEEAETATIVGWLGSASALRGTVEIRTDSGEVIRAKTDEALTPHLREFFENRVEAVVEFTRVRSAGGRERRIYAVIELRNT
jgi:hypothetical protein